MAQKQKRQGSYFSGKEAEVKKVCPSGLLALTLKTTVNTEAAPQNVSLLEQIPHPDGHKSACARVERHNTATWQGIALSKLQFVNT